MPGDSISKALNHVRHTLQARDLAEASDGQLVQRFISTRDEGAFEAIVRRHGTMVLGVCRRVLRDHHGAEDAFQATFLVLARKASSIRRKELVASWLYGVALHTAMRARASAHRRQAHEKLMSEPPEPEVCPKGYSDLMPLLDKELSCLPEKYRLPIVLCDLEGKPYADAARQLGWLPGTLSGRLWRARSMLAKRLTRRGIGLSAVAISGLIAESAKAVTCVAPALHSMVVKAACNLAFGDALPATVSPAAVALFESVSRSLALSKLKVALAGILVVCTLALAAGWSQRGRLTSTTDNEVVSLNSDNEPAPRFDKPSENPPTLRASSPPEPVAALKIELKDREVAANRDLLEAFDRLSGGKDILTSDDFDDLDALRADFLSFLRVSGPAAKQMTREEYAAWLEWRKLRQAAQPSGRDNDLPTIEELRRTMKKLAAASASTLLVQSSAGSVTEVAADGTPHWTLTDLAYPRDAEGLTGGRVLITEQQQISERTIHGDVLWRYEINDPMSAQRLKNGHTFIVGRDRLLEVDSTGNNYLNLTGNYAAARRLRNGQIVAFDRRNVIQLDADGLTIKSARVRCGGGGWNEVLDNGHVLALSPGNGNVIEFDLDGNTVGRFDYLGANNAARLPNGHTLVLHESGNEYIELDEEWKLVKRNMLTTPATKLKINLQSARLAFAPPLLQTLVLV
jgi:RNA polymerase sigma factor (sigma-70 family)